MKIEIHKSEERGSSRLDWLDSKHSFSFADYHDHHRMGFGALRVLNEDFIEPGQGFGFHHHDNMEIVTIVLKGSLEHKDSLGNHGVINMGDVQRMSAGSGIMHSEFNHSKNEQVHLLQIWVQTKEKNIKPSYEQKNFSTDLIQNKNKLTTVVSGDSASGALTIHQDCKFLLGNLDQNHSLSYRIQDKTHGVYLFLIDGELMINEKKVQKGDAAALSHCDQVQVNSTKNSQFLLMDVPQY